jgi:glycosyltransferase involved in cell wall biosynthesis
MSTTKHIVIDARIRRASTGRPIDRLLEYLQDIDTTNRYTILLQPDDPWQPRAGNFTPLPCPYPQFSFNPLTEIKFSRLIYSLKPDLVHFTMTQQPLLYFGNIVTMTHDTTMYHFIRRGATPLPVYKLKMGLYRFLVWWSHRKSRKIVVPTHTVAKEIIALQHFTRNRLVVINEAAEPAASYTAKRPAAIGQNDQFIMYVGTAFPHKNLATLVQGFELLVQRHPKLKLVLVGKREKHYEELEQQIKQSPAASNIILTGFISDEELAWLFQHTRAYVFVSLSEGWGLPPLEAMANGAPVISSDMSVMPEVYGDAAYYCNPRKPEDICTKVDDVITNDGLRQELIAKGYKQLKKYSWKKWASEHYDLYKSLLQK